MVIASVSGMEPNQDLRDTPEIITVENIQTFLDLTRLLRGNDYRILEGFMSSDQITVLLEEQNSGQAAVKRLRWEIKMVLRKNHWTFETQSK